MVLSGLSDKHYRLILLAGIILLSVYGVWRHIDYRIQVEDDLMWSYQTSVGLTTNPEIFNEVEERYLQYLRPQTDDGQWEQRATVRKDLGERQNYLGGNLIVFATAKWIRKFTSLDPDVDYPSYIAAAYLSGFVVQALLVALFAFAVMFAVSDKKLMAIIAGTLVYILFADFFEASAPQDFISQNAFERGPVYIFGGFLKMLSAPLMSFSPFYPPFKSRLVILVLMCFLVRWRGYTAWSYWLLFLAAFFHQGYGGIVILFVIAVDVIKRPEVFKDYKILLPAVLGVVSYFLRDGTIREAFSSLDIATVALTAIVAAGGFFFLRKPLLLIRKKTYVPISTLLKNDDILTDIGVLSFLWFASLIMFIPISLSVDELSSRLLWGQVHGRILGVFHPVLLFCGLYCAYNLLERKVTADIIVRGMVLVLGTSIFFFYSYAFLKMDTPRETYQNLHHDFVKLDNLSQGPLPEFKELAASDEFGMTQGEIVESIMYYALSKTSETGDNYYAPLFLDKD